MFVVYVWRVLLLLRDSHPQTHELISRSHDEFVGLIQNGVPAARPRRRSPPAAAAW
eukprot:gene1827-11205_t